ncbi:hypothetical protein NLU13_6637 [Sarocladium strictum]|uniref:Acid phosphatase n=1 Tax=Sarocladium strictum TaxID=5046 RepID=A0AA39GGV9_SARSR|nr:hypothetical protein NLU13_6637 [Sarocladium strictum]
MRAQIASLLALASVPFVAANGEGCGGASKTGWETVYTASGTADVAAAAATAKTSSPTSHVKGKVFDRIAFIWFENTDFNLAAGDPNFARYAEKGIKLTSYYGVTHPSEPNYMAAIAGDYFGMENDKFSRAPKNVSTVMDLLEHRGISWGAYQEDMPYSGYEGFEWVNHQNGRNDYVRKHNPPVLMDSITYSEKRLSQIKNISLTDPEQSQFHKDLKEDKLPQWIFITPNMTSDGHDSSVTVAGQWCKTFLDPLLNDPNFMKNTLVVITWDENETYAKANNILGILLGDAVPQHLVGTTDDSFYNHYSEIATVSANWGLPSLGRWDVGANVYRFVGEKTGDKIRKWSKKGNFQGHYWNESYAGPFNSGGGNPEFAAPNLELDHNVAGRDILSSVKKQWKHSDVPTYYEDTIEIPDGLNPPKGYAPVA